ncbi:unnamed protein product [Umbelopsis ramanniana]
MTTIFTPLTLPNGAVLPNRIAKAATQEHLADENQNPSKELFQLYKAWSEGGSGLTISGHIMVDRRSVGGAGDVVLEDDSNLDMFKEWAQVGTVGGNHFWLQINHPGKQMFYNLGQPALAPSAIPLSNASMFAVPQEITEAQILEVIERFKTTSQLAERAGFNGVQIHAAHGYLLSQFLSPLSNKREDKWGGSLENRARLLFEVIKSVRSAVSPSFCVAVKINSADFQRVDLVELSGGNLESPVIMGPDAAMNDDKESKAASTIAREAYFLTFAEELSKVATMPIMLTGGITRRAVMDKVIEGGVAIIGMATALILKPDLPNDLKNDLDPNPRMPSINWREKSLTALVKISYLNHYIRITAENQDINSSVWPSWTLMKQLWSMNSRAKIYRKHMKGYTYKGPVTAQ